MAPTPPAKGVLNWNPTKGIESMKRAEEEGTTASEEPNKGNWKITGYTWGNSEQGVNEPNKGNWKKIILCLSLDSTKEPNKGNWKFEHMLQFHFLESYGTQQRELKEKQTYYQKEPLKHHEPNKGNWKFIASLTLANSCLRTQQRELKVSNSYSNIFISSIYGTQQRELKVVFFPHFKDFLERKNPTKGIESVYMLIILQFKVLLLNPTKGIERYTIIQEQL